MAIDFRPVEKSLALPVPPESGLTTTNFSSSLYLFIIFFIKYYIAIELGEILTTGIWKNPDIYSEWGSMVNTLLAPILSIIWAISEAGIASRLTFYSRKLIFKKVIMKYK